MRWYLLLTKSSGGECLTLYHSKRDVIEEVCKLPGYEHVVTIWEITHVGKLTPMTIVWQQPGRFALVEDIQADRGAKRKETPIDIDWNTDQEGGN